MNDRGGEYRRIDFAVVGAQKAGSTYLLESLRNHPDIFMPRSEVAHFEDGLFEHAGPGDFNRHFIDADEAQVVGFKRPNLLGLPSMARRLRTLLGDLRIIVILRDPVDRAISGYFHYMSTGLLPVLPADEGLSRLLDRGGDAFPGFPRAEEVLTFGLYGHHLDSYLERFPRSKVKVISLESLRDPRPGLHDLYRFLGVDADRMPPPPTTRPMGAPYSISRIRLKNALESPLKVWDASGSYFSYRDSRAARWGLRLIRAFDRRMLARIYRQGPPDLPGIRERLADYYREDQTRLAMTNSAGTD